MACLILKHLTCADERRRQPGIQRPPALLPHDAPHRVGHPAVQRQRPSHAVLDCGQ
jgi:hypothetical protein